MHGQVAKRLRLSHFIFIHTHQLVILLQQGAVDAPYLTACVLATKGPDGKIVNICQSAAGPGASNSPALVMKTVRAVLVGIP